ncbi:ATP-binding protein [Parvularcula flava]|nr:ATP-binding protein [Aquisalinus luteolus]
MPGSGPILRSLLRAGREAPDPSPAIAWLSQANPSAYDLDTREKAADFLSDMEASEAAKSWLAGEGDEERLAMVRLLVRQGRMKEAAPLYRALVDENPAMRDGDLDAALMARGAAPSGGGAEVFSLSGERLGGRAEAGGDKDERDAIMVESVRKQITFEDVGGLADIKKQISRKIILPFQKPAMFKRFRKQAGGGVLLYGPPGCGKTMLARATAGECGARFVNVEIPEILDMYIGESEKRLAAVFEEARADRPTVLFFDELEALAARRKFSHNSNSSALVSTFLNEMDGYSADNAGLLILAATNTPWAIDPAFRRHGRFDRVLFVPPPDKVARLEILRSLLAERPQEKLDLEAVVAKTSGFSGADLTNVVETACDIAIEESLDSDEISPISKAHLAEALKEVKSSTGEWLSSARNYARYANEGGLYEDVLAFLDKNMR